MASGWMPEGLSEPEIADGEAYHRALYLDGDIGHPAGWHRDSVERLIQLAIPHISEGSTIVDYGSGTGGSAIELLKVLDEIGIKVQLILVDPLPSWFGKAREILGDRDDVHLELSVGVDEDGKLKFRKLGDILSGRKVDVIISSSTLHLIPERAISGLAREFHESLRPGGAFVWDSGDIECDFRPDDSARLHDPYRAVREILREDAGRMELLARLGEDGALKEEKRLDRIFPEPFSLDVIIGALEEAGFEGEVSDKVVDFSKKDAQRFVLVPRLAEIAAPLLEGEARGSAIKRALERALKDMEEEGFADEHHYRSHWVYGRHIA